MTAPLTSAIVDHTANVLKWRVDARYNLLNGSVNQQWRWGQGRGQAESLSELRETLALDPAMRVLVVHGFTDLVTPYFASQLLLDQLPPLGDDERVALRVYPGGHMFYSRDASRTAFRNDAEALYRAALAARRAERPGP
jgi:carboxypeptidase C (cathepsin A)